MLEGHPRLKAGCRLAAEGDVLFIPESVLRLQGPARLIVEACDGATTVPQIVAQLLAAFPDSKPAKVSEETTAFLTRLIEKGAIELV